MSLAASKLARLGLSLAGASIILVITADGIGVTPNSVTYLTGARSLLRGEGLLALDPVSGTLAPMTIHAPVYAVLLAAAGSPGVDPVDAARWLNVIVFGASILVLAWMVRGATGSDFRALLAAFFFGFSVNSLELHVFAWSEPLFILFCLSGLQALVLYLDGGGRRLLLLASACLAAMALTRYAGAAIVAGAAVSLLVEDGRGRGRRLADLALFTLVSCGPLAAWMARNAASGAVAGGKPVALHPIGGYHVWAAIDSIAALVFPARAPAWARGAVALAAVMAFAGLLVAGVASARAGDWPRRRRLATRVLATAVVSYVVFYVLYVSVVDWSLTLTGRLLAPLFSLGVALIFVGWAPGESGWKAGAGVRLAARCVVIALCVFMLARLARLALVSPFGWRDYSISRLEGSDFVRRVRDLPEETVIYTNNVEHVHYLTDRPARGLPWVVNKYSRIENAAFGEELDRVRRAVADGSAVLVYIDGIEEYFLPSEEALTEALGLEVIVEEPEGRIFTGSGTNE